MNASNHSFCVDDYPDKKPKAIVLLLGWWGAKSRHLAKYGQLYQERDCLTVQAICDTYAILVRNTRSIDQCAIEAAAHVAQVLRDIDDDTIPVIFHAFSNGGAYVVERMEAMIRHARTNSLPSDQDSDMVLVGKHLQGQIYDSAPVWPTTESAVEAAAGVFSNPIARKVVALLFYLHQFISSLYQILFRVMDWRQVFWSNLAEHALCTKQAFIYSEADTITNVKKLEELIAMRQKKSDEVLVKKFEDSLHVQHLRTHPQEYVDLLDKFLALFS
jgi:hypothetical protein